MRKAIFENGYFYHVYNRGVDKRRLFLNKYDYFRFLKSMTILNVVFAVGSLRNVERQSLAAGQTAECTCPTSAVAEVGHVHKTTAEKPLVEIVAYSLIGNHFHLILRQVMDRGIPMFMQRLGTSWYKDYENFTKDIIMKIRESRDNLKAIMR